MGPTRRELITLGGSAMALAALRSGARSQPDNQSQIRIGVIVPSSTGLTVIPTSINDFIGDAALQGALVAEGVVGTEAARDDRTLIILKANSPTPEAAERAAKRLIATEGVHAVVGGVGEGQADPLSAVAEEAQIPFFNIGSPSLALRARCARFTFHIEASAAMYLDAMVTWGARQGFRRWFIVYPTIDEGTDLQRRAVVAVSKHGAGGITVGAASAIPRQPFYGPQFEAARNAGADALLVLLSDMEQIVFIAQQANTDVFIPTLLFPHPNTQTRDYIAAARASAPSTNPDYRFALWDSTLEEHGAAEFNARYISRWGDPADPPAWSAYHAIKIFFEASKRAGSVDGRATTDEIVRDDATFDLLKGPGTSFRAWDHQLRQPLYLVRVDQTAPWDRNIPSTRVAVAEHAATFPDERFDGQIARLDRFGDGTNVINCAGD